MNIVKCVLIRLDSKKLCSMIFIKKSISKKQILLILMDLVILSVVPFITLYIYFLIKVGFGFKFQYLRFEHLYFISNLLIFIVVFYVMDLHNFKKNFVAKKQVLNIFLAICFAWVLSIIFFYIIGNPPLGRGISFIYLSTLFILIVLFRFVYSKLAVSSIYAKKAIIVGAAKGGESVAELIKTNPQLNIKIICFLDIDKQKEGKRICEAPVECNKDTLIAAVADHKPDMIILAMRRSRYEKIIKDIINCSQKGIEIRDIASIFEEIAGKIPLKYVSDFWILYSHMNKTGFYFKKIKRLVDILSSFILLIISTPVMIITALAIKLDSKGPVFYRQSRVGKDGINFELIKFRSMVKDAENNGAVWAADKDKRITRVGKIIRLLRIDELPQLFNVLKGEMSFVGPRPERPEFVSNFLGSNGNNKDIIPHYGERLAVKPGLTGWAQVMYPYASSYKESLEKLEYDLYYIKNMSFLLDISIILKTIHVILFRDGAK